MPTSRPMPAIGPSCHELRINDGNTTFRIIYYVDPEAVVILEVFLKKTRTTPKQTIDVARKRLRAYRRAVQEESREN